eukprot:CAMPEP_0113568120 /NCGR_PEP_ID=MMETSP0015_2-20120614/23666_1 /TAXON_ID=2838 /ORGANISM="Odontella" /LENGTH=228 /DNA_ID=CAMNT_0000470613 /DNA_START=264 /DNA_END=947 /DNA_ORIENTATION=+ /assembly_acc=CAM_ASM_000160
MSGADDDNEAADDQTEEGVSLPEDPAAISKTCSPLAPFDLFGWRPDPELTDDENYMDVVLLITRHSVCDWQGHMGSIIVDPALGLEEGGAQKQPDQKEEGFQEGIGKEEVRIRRLERRLLSHVISAATNSPLYGKEDSDLHAEIDALGQACRSHRSTEGCSVYITMPPCRRCFAALVAFRVGRIVSRKLPPEKIRAVAAERGIEVVELTAAQKRTQMARINALVNRSR